MKGDLKMEENRITISLQEYLKLYDKSKEIDSDLKELKNYLFNCFEYKKDKDTIIFDKYNLNNNKITNLLII